MNVSSRTPEGIPNRCPICGHSIRIEPSIPSGDAPCPNCGSLLWFAQTILDNDVDVLLHDVFIPDLRATNKPDAIHEIVAQMSAVRVIEPENEEDIVRSIMKRENLGSTGIGNGFAVPHTEHSSVARLIAATAVSRNGIEFNGLDDLPVHTIFLLLYPIDRPGDHLRALERISRHLRTQESLP